MRTRAYGAWMPEVSRFYGIIITINYDDHLPPHFHARQGDDRAAIRVDGVVLAGSLPRRALALVRDWASQHRAELLRDWELARAGERLDAIAPLDQDSWTMLEIQAVEPLEGRSVRMTLSDGTVVERDLTDLLWGPIFAPIVADEGLFRSVSVDYGTLVWPGNVDMAPETLIWDGPYPADDSRRPKPFLRPRSPSRPTR